MEPTRLTDYYLPPGEGFVLETLVATTYQVDFEFLEEELLAAALGVRSPVSRMRAFRSELERKLQRADVSVLYDLRGCERLARLSPRIDALPVARRKLHSKISLLMWVREGRGAGTKTDRRMRLIVGSANLTRQGFRENYEYVVAADFGGKNTSPRALLTKAMGLVREIGEGIESPQFTRQLDALAKQAGLLDEGTVSPDDPVALVTAEDAVSTVRATWEAGPGGSPDKLTVVSPFWVAGATGGAALADLIRDLGSPPGVELICRGEKLPDGREWLPVFDGAIAADLKARLPGRLVLRAARPDPGEPSAPQSGAPTGIDAGDESEESELAARRQEARGKRARQKEPEADRPLHGKMLLLDGKKGSVLYVGSSNCTRLGLGFGLGGGGRPNFEAGFVYRLSAKQRKQLEGLLRFAGPEIEVQVGATPPTVPPPADEPLPVPTFIAAVVASGTKVAIHFRETAPSDLVLLMPIPTKAGDAGYWLLYRAHVHGVSAGPVVVDLTTCSRCDDKLHPLGDEPAPPAIFPHVFVEARWGGHSATFAVRFDDKAQLPLLLVGRKPSEGELIDYFLFGKEPEDGGDGGGPPGAETEAQKADAPVDTRRILAYFMRRFVQAIPGIEAEVLRGAYSRVALEAALRGPTSPLELAERAFQSLARKPAADEPQKTPMAVGFQLAEIVAVLERCRGAVDSGELRPCFTPVISRCRDLLNTLVSQQPELQTGAFPDYAKRIIGGAQ